MKRKTKPFDPLRPVRVALSTGVVQVNIYRCGDHQFINELADAVRRGFMEGPHSTNWSKLKNYYATDAGREAVKQHQRKKKTSP